MADLISTEIGAATLINEEWYIPSSDTPLRQGDLLIRRNPKTGEIAQICLVITADCDISKHKFGTHLAALRIIPLEAYIRRIWAEKRLANVFDKEFKKIQDQLNKWNAVLTPGATALSPEVVINWLKTNTAAEICEQLSIPAPDSDRVKKNLEMFQMAIEVIDKTNTADDLEKLAAFCAITQAGKTQKEHLNIYIKKAHEDELAEDVFLLTTLPQIDNGPAVILFREIISIQETKIYFRASEAASDDVFLRIGKLDATIQYAVSQAFGSLYSRIGLPSAYEKHRTTAIETSVIKLLIK